MNESGNKEDQVGMEVANPNLIVKKQTLKKMMNGNPQK
jgi:hypothetical protein